MKKKNPFPKSIMSKLPLQFNYIEPMANTNRKKEKAYKIHINKKFGTDEEVPIPFYKPISKLF